MGERGGVQPTKNHAVYLLDITGCVIGWPSGPLPPALAPASFAFPAVPAIDELPPWAFPPTLLLPA